MSRIGRLRGAMSPGSRQGGRLDRAWSHFLNVRGADSQRQGKKMIIAEASKTVEDIGVSPVDRLHALVEDDMVATDRLIHERMGSAVALIPELTRHLIDSGGKRLRPLLTLA